MKYIIFALVFTYVVATASSVNEVEDGEYNLVHLIRDKRQNRNTGFQIQSPGIATIHHSGTILDNPNHRLDGSGYASKDISNGFHGIRPDAYGGRVDYSHKPSHSVLGVSADHMRGAGTDVKASGTWNFVQTKNAEVGLTGQYGRHYGAGGSKPDYGVFVGGKINF